MFKKANATPAILPSLQMQNQKAAQHCCGPDTHAAIPNCYLQGMAAANYYS
jgi:hypothetical protein